MELVKWTPDKATVGKWLGLRPRTQRYITVSKVIENLKDVERELLHKMAGRGECRPSTMDNEAGWGGSSRFAGGDDAEADPVWKTRPVNC